MTAAFWSTTDPTRCVLTDTSIIPSLAFFATGNFEVRCNHTEEDY